MSKAEKFISDCTRTCSNEFEPQKAPPSVYNPWLTPDQARRAVEIAREEMIEEACEYLNDNLLISDLDSYNYLVMTEENKQSFIEDFRKAIGGK